MLRVSSLFVLALIVSGCATPATDRTGEPGDPPESGPTYDASQARVERGYIQMPDGVLLAYTAKIPGEGKFPILLGYDGYNAGTGFTNYPWLVDRYVSQGYVVAGVSIRGTGCSGGAFDFFDEHQGKDGAVAVEWLANQSWSNGRVGMYGKSWPGITQLDVAAEQPSSLVAIAPGHFLTDAYRDVAYPGGMLNVAFASLWGLEEQPRRGAEGVADRAPADETCRANQQQHGDDPSKHVVAFGAAHPLDDEAWHRKSLVDFVGRVHVPTLAVLAWQDEEVGARGVHALDDLQAPWWAILSNGDHFIALSEDSLATMDRFFERYVKGVENGFEATPRVTVWWETRDGVEWADAKAGWTSTIGAWPAATTPLWLNLTTGKRLAAGASDGSTLWMSASPGPMNKPLYSVADRDKSQGEQLTDAAPTPPLRATWTTEPFEEDTVFLGPANLTLWISTGAPDVDIQATLREITPEGATIVQRGWLKASHRALDAANTTLLRPEHQHTRADALPRDTPVQLSIEIQPFGHPFRAGTRLELGIESPALAPELWGFLPSPPALVTILHDAEHASTLILPHFVGQTIDGPAPRCGELSRQACEPRLVEREP